MNIDKIIKKKRLELKLTQEQVANYLGVTTPAVNKWEKGASYPDITLISPLARLLKIDVNTLMNFNQEMSDIEIAHLANEISQAIYKDGFETGYDKAMDKIKEYPNCYKLILNLALILQGNLYMFHQKELDLYEKNVGKLFNRCIESDDMEVNHLALTMLISNAINKDDLDEAQSLLDTIPDIHFDKKTQQGFVYMKREDYKKASELFEGKLMNNIMEVNSSLMAMIDIALKENRIEDALYLAKAIEKNTDTFDLWAYYKYIGHYQVYAFVKDEENTVRYLKEILNSLKINWNFSNSAFCKNISKTETEENTSNQIFEMFVSSIKTNVDGELNFLKNNKEFQELLDTI